jgi:5-methylcytosine-specific restriction endonuclease McrA
MWSENNQEHLREYRKEYNKRNKSKKDGQNIIYYQQNKKYYNNYYSTKYWNEDKFNLTKRTYSIVRQAILKNKSGWVWEVYVGYTLHDLIGHLKATLSEDYSWNDYLEGKLELDHIIPVSAFNFSKPTDYEFQECWNLNNLRLITPKENHSKGSKILF